ncbi:MAG: HAMP domain-containing sensor histidine kinase [Tannerellaceae bacterium]
MRLNELTENNILSPVAKDYADLLLEEAELQNNVHYRATALFHLIRYYYGRSPDSMRYYIDVAIPVFIADKRIDDLLRVKSWNIYTLSREGMFNLVPDAVNELKRLAKKYNNKNGEDLANQSLADYYLSNHLQHEGEQLYEEILQNMEERDAPIVKQTYILRQLINRHSSADKRMFYLEKLARIVHKCKEKGITDVGDEVSVDYLEYLVYRGYAMEAYKQKNLKMLKSNYKKLERMVEVLNMVVLRSDLASAKAYCLRLEGHYDEAIAIYDKLLQQYICDKRMMAILETYKEKANTYYEAGRGMEAMDASRIYVQIKDSISETTYYNKLAELKTKYELNKLELNSKQMELEHSETRGQMLVMFGGLILLALICLLLGYVAYSRSCLGKALQLGKDKAEEADKLKSAFLANMNHEIRTPLNAIIGFSQVLIEEEDKDKREEFAQIIYHNNELLQRLISDVLDISKIESNMITFTYALTDLPQLMKEIYNMTLLHMPEGVELILAPTPSVEIQTDRNRLTQVLTNLLTNATKYTVKGSICFGYEVLETEIAFYIKDTGHGIPADKLETVFSRFVQLNDYTKGVGLGLAICKGFVDKMGGRIELISEVGVGSTFTVILPRKK